MTKFSLITNFFIKNKKITAHIIPIKFNKILHTLIKSWVGYFIIGIFFQSFIWAGVSGKVSGKVIDKDTGEALSGANVVVSGTTQGTMADKEGEYYILNLKNRQMQWRIIKYRKRFKVNWNKQA